MISKKKFVTAFPLQSLSLMEDKKEQMEEVLETPKYKFEIIPDEQTPKVETEVTQESEVIDAFFEYAKSLKTRAVGLAANQCSMNGERLMQNMFAFVDPETNVWDLAINPELVEPIGYLKPRIEGCLTWAGKDILVNRYLGIRVRYYSHVKQQPVERDITGFEAQIFQHEMNHLEGVEELVVDREYINRPLTKETKELKEPFQKPKKFQRNDSCPCGSGKKYKKCCIKLDY